MDVSGLFVFCGSGGKIFSSLSEPDLSSCSKVLFLELQSVPEAVSL